MRSPQSKKLTKLTHIAALPTNVTHIAALPTKVTHIAQHVHRARFAEHLTTMRHRVVCDMR